MADVVIDTNVAIVANGRTEQAGIECEEACIAALERIHNARRVTADNGEDDRCRVVLDDGDDIMNEYLRHLNPSGSVRPARPGRCVLQMALGQPVPGRPLRKGSDPAG